jgi:hypothetical protein
MISPRGANLLSPCRVVVRDHVYRKSIRSGVMKVSRLLPAGGIVLGACLCGYCSGLIRPPRPMFHEGYGPVGFGVVLDWKGTPPFIDPLGHWAVVDEQDNLAVVQATGSAERWRSKPWRAGRTETAFRLGGAEDREGDAHVTIPRMKDALVVILPDGRWQEFPLRPGQASAFFRPHLTRRSPDLLAEARVLLTEGDRAKFGTFLKGYVPPPPQADDRD